MLLVAAILRLPGACRFFRSVKWVIQIVEAPSYDRIVQLLGEAVANRIVVVGKVVHNRVAYAVTNNRSGQLVRTIE